MRVPEKKGVITGRAGDKRTRGNVSRKYVKFCHSKKGRDENRKGTDRKRKLMEWKVQCLDPSVPLIIFQLNILSLYLTGSTVCPLLPRPSPCPNVPNECTDQTECSVGQKCCSDGCRMICAEPIVVPTTQPPRTFRKFTVQKS